MIDPQTYEHLASVLLLVSLAILLVVGVWAAMARLPRALFSKYPKSVVYKSTMPFAYAWRAAVEVDDLPTFERARLRKHVFLVMLLLLIQVVSFHSYAHVVAQLYRCNLQGIGLH